MFTLINKIRNFFIKVIYQTSDENFHPQEYKRFLILTKNVKKKKYQTSVKIKILKERLSKSS